MIAVFISRATTIGIMIALLHRGKNSVSGRKSMKNLLRVEWLVEQYHSSNKADDTCKESQGSKAENTK